MQTEAQREAEAIVPGECEPIPKPECVRGRCPVCGAPLVSRLTYREGKGYLLTFDCWKSYGVYATCEYFRVI